MRHEFRAVDRADPSYPVAVVDYICQDFLVRSGRVPQVYEELLNLAYWTRGFAPRNIMEIGTAGGTFFVLSQFATGKKLAIDVNDVRPKLHELMFGHDWCFLQGNSQTPAMQARVRSYCDSFDVILIDGDHTFNGVKKDFENYRELLSSRGTILFHDVDPDHIFKGFQGGDVWRFWRELEMGLEDNVVLQPVAGSHSMLRQDGALWRNRDLEAAIGSSEQRILTLAGEGLGNARVCANAS